MERNIYSKKMFASRSGRWAFAGGLAIASLVLLPAAQAVNPPPDGGYPGFNTAEGTNALFSLTTGAFNTALGGQALKFTTTGSNNTAVGVNALVFNVSGVENVAVGQGALANNTGIRNVAIGFQALGHNTTAGNASNALGWKALYSQTTGAFNNGFGWEALYSNVTGGGNTAFGDAAGYYITGDGNVCIGSNVYGVAGENNTTRIKNIGTTPYNAGRYVQVDAAGKLGYVVSSRRYKHEIEAMDKASEALYALKPVTFRYNGDIDPTHVKMFGLIAEDVAEVNPDLAVRSAEGKLDTIRFDSINAMLLNEFLKEHRKVQEQEACIAQLQSTVAKQEAMIAQQQKGMDALAANLKEQAAQIQKVSAEIAVSKAAPQVVRHDN